jgi:glycosyltransferase involved in cell wall biosynthesis
MTGPLLIDVSRLVGRTLRGRFPTGIDRVCLTDVERFGPRARAVVQWRGWRRIGTAEASRRLFELLLKRDPGRMQEAARLMVTGFLRPGQEAKCQGAIYLNVGHTGLEAPGLTQWLQALQARAVYMVHDLIPLTHPEYCRPGEAERHGTRMEAVLRTGAAVLANSQATLDDLRTFAHNRSLPMPPALAAPLAPAQFAANTLDRPPLDAPYFVMLGTIEPRKNHWMLLHVWRRLAEEMGSDAPHLVIVGQRGWECENVVDLLERCAPLRGFVHELPACSDTLLAQYLAHARALLFPSFAEGYGLPLVEALMLGTPAIASALPAFAEAAGQVPDYLDPLDGPAWTQAVRDYMRPEHPRRAEQMLRLQQFRAPTWAQHFERVEPLLESLE